MRNFQSTPLMLLLLLSLALALTAEGRRARASGIEVGKEKKEKATVYIVDVHRPEGVDPEEFDIRTLGSVLGSKEAAKRAIVYHYIVLSGFAAKLTPSQVKELKKQPGVLLVEPDHILVNPWSLF